MIYVIKENGYGYRERIVGAVSDEKTAKRYCRDMRTGRELFYEAVELDAVTMDEISAEKIYVVERRVPWKANKDVPVTEMYKELMNIDPVALVEVDHFMTVTYASLRTLRLESDLDGTALSFWCYAKSAPAALGIMERTLKDFDPSVLEWGVYHPLKGDNKELKRRIDQFNIRRKPKAKLKN